MFFKKESRLVLDSHENSFSPTDIDWKSMIVWAICVILFLIFYWKLRDIGPVILEDYYMVTYTKSFFVWRDSLALSQGRVSYFISCWFWAFAFFNYTLLKYQIIRMLWTALCIFSVWRLMRDLTNKAIAQLCVLLSLIFFVVQIAQHDLLFSYPGFAHVPFSCLLLGLDTQLRYLDTKKKRWMILTVLLAFISGFCQEGFLLDYLMYALLAFCVYYIKSEANNWKKILIKAIKSLVPIIITGVVILALYVAWKTVHPGDYAGAQFSFISKKGILITWFTLMNGMFPLRTAVRHFLTFSDFSLLSNLGMLDVFVAIISCVGVAFSFIQVKREQALPTKKNILILLGCALGCALAPALHALTSSYVSQVLNGFTYSYTISFFSYFFIMAAITLTLSIVLHVTKSGMYKGCVCAFTFCIFGASLVNSASNNFALHQIQQESDASNASDDFFRNKDNRNICVNHTLYLDPNDIIQTPRVFYSVWTGASTLSEGETCSVVEYDSPDITSYPDNAIKIWYDGEAFHAQPVS